MIKLNSEIIVSQQLIKKKTSLYDKILNKNVFLLFLTYIIVKKILFWGRIFEMETLMDLHIMRSPESEIITFYRLICVSECVPVIKVTQK